MSKTKIKPWKDLKIKRQWEKNLEEPQYSRKDIMEVVSEYRRFQELIGKKALYIGESNEYYTKNETYTVIDFGYHWHRFLGYVVWTTDDLYPDTTDIDYACSNDADTFFEVFVPLD